MWQITDSGEEGPVKLHLEVVAGLEEVVRVENLALVGDHSKDRDRSFNKVGEQDLYDETDFSGFRLICTV